MNPLTTAERLALTQVALSPEGLQVAKEAGIEDLIESALAKLQCSPPEPDPSLEAQSHGDAFAAKLKAHTEETSRSLYIKPLEAWYMANISARLPKNKTAILTQYLRFNLHVKSWPKEAQALADLVEWIKCAKDAGTITPDNCPELYNIF